MTQAIEVMLLTTDEVAERLRMKPDTVHKWRQRNMGPPYLRIGGKILYNSAELQDWIAEQRE